MATRIQLRRGPAAAWTAANPVLTVGEPGVESDTGKVKIGDGTSAWSALPYILDVEDLEPVVADMMAATAADGTSAFSVAQRAAFGSRWAVLRQLLDGRARSNYPPVASPAPTVTFTAGTDATTISGGVAIPVLAVPNSPELSSQFAYLGAPLSNRGTSGLAGTVAQATSGTGGSGSALTGGSYPASLEGEFDGATLELIGFQDGGAVQYRLWVDGQPVSHAAESEVGTPGAPNRLTIPFGSRRPRRVRLDFSRLFGPIQAWIGPADTLAPAAPRAGSLLVIADSYGDGSGDVGALDTYAASLVNLLGCGDYYLDAHGGTGFVADGGGGAKAAYGARLTRVPDGWEPDIVLLQGSTNDWNAGAGLTAAVEACIATCRARWPLAAVALTGIMQPVDASQLDGFQAANNTALAALADQVDIFIDPVGGDWFSGSGKVGSPTGSGNADLYRSSDGVHPSQAGHDYLAARVAADIMQGLATLAA